MNGIHIDNVGLHTLRKKMAIISQDNYIFGGSLRFNIDPFDEHSDLDVLSIIQKIKLIETLFEKEEVQVID